MWIIATCLIILGVIVALLLAFTPYKTALGLIPLFNMDLELTVTAYYNSFILAFSALMLLLIAQDKKKTKDKFWKYWRFLSFGFLFLSLDEAASIHEFIANIPRHYMQITSPINFAIAILGFAVTLITLTIYFKFLMSLPSNTRMQFLVSGFVYVLGAFGAELMGGFISSVGPGWSSGYYLTEVVIEESLEIIGITLFIRALILYIENDLFAVGSIFQTDNTNQHGSLAGLI